MKCKCVSCLISQALEKGKIPKNIADAFLLGYHYYGMTHTKSPDDAGWHAEGVDFYSEQLDIKPLTDIIRIAKEL